MPAVTGLLQQAESLTQDCRTALARAFEQNDYPKATQLVTRLKYLTKLVEDAKSRKSRMVRLP